MDQRGRHTPLAVATGNTSKAGEYEILLPRLIPWKRSDEIQQRFRRLVDLPENAPSFIGNAWVKAEHAAKHLGVHSLGDDAGLEVDYLTGGAHGLKRPGLYSKRYAPTAEERLQKLMHELQDVPLHQRTASFTCGVALANAQGMVVATAEGKIAGRIALALGPGLPDFDYSAIFQVKVRGVWKYLGEVDHTWWVMNNHRHAACFHLFKQVGWIN